MKTIQQYKYEILEDFKLQESILKKLNVIKELITYYPNGKNLTLGEIEDMLWDQYFKYNKQTEEILNELKNEHELEKTKTKLIDIIDKIDLIYKK